MLRCLILPSASTWSISFTSFTTGGYDFFLPANANPGTVTVTTLAGVCGPGPDGTSFVVKADGVTKLTTGCIVNTSQNASIPANTLIVHVDVTNNCLGGGRNAATFTISGSG